jgi:hypothetical protein
MKTGTLPSNRLWALVVWVGLIGVMLLVQFCAVAPSATSTSLPTVEPVTFLKPLNISGSNPWMTYYNGFYYLAATTHFWKNVYRRTPG